MEAANEHISRDLALINSEVLRLASHSDRLRHLQRHGRRAADLSALAAFTDAIPDVVAKVQCAVRAGRWD